MAGEIMKQLLYSLFISLGASFPFAWESYKDVYTLEERQGMFIVLMISVGICLFNFVISLVALLNLVSSVRQNFWKSLLAFLSLPYMFFFFLVIFFLLERSPEETFRDFFEMALSTIVFIIVLTFQFYRFRKRIASME